MNRRKFNLSLLGATTALTLPHHARADAPSALTARVGMTQLAPPDFGKTQVWTYDGTVPGPTLRLRQGDRVHQRFVNELPQASSVHWHGIRIENAMDGVVGMTQQAVAPGEAFVYSFTAPDAGTYWYHPHNRTWEQMARGLYGALIVDEAEGAPEVDLDEVLLLDDWRLSEDAQIADDFGNMHDWSHGGRIGNWITVNGDGAWSRDIARNARMRLRLVNTANARIFTVEPRGLTGWIVALDGMPLDTPQPFDSLTLAPAQRADVFVDVVAPDGDEAFLLSIERDGGYALTTFNIRGTKRNETLAEPAALPPNPVPALGPLEQARKVDLVMDGGAMGGMGEAMLNGQMTGMRALVAEGKAWAFNGAADMPDTPLIEASRGETIRISMRNDTAWPHAMHLHGHHFHPISEIGTPGPLRDTLLINRAETAEIAFVADNPGDWLLHCHMLEHSASGMMTWLRVT